VLLCHLSVNFAVKDNTLVPRKVTHVLPLLVKPSHLLAYFCSSLLLQIVSKGLHNLRHRLSCSTRKGGGPLRPLLPSMSPWHSISSRGNHAWTPRVYFASRPSLEVIQMNTLKFFQTISRFGWDLHVCIFQQRSNIMERCLCPCRVHSRKRGYTSFQKTVSKPSAQGAPPHSSIKR